MSPLKRILLDDIRRGGPISLHDYMQRALADPEHGYYMQRRPFGTAGQDGGDFITAPEVSQMFGELLGAWAADLWDRMGRPAKLCLAEAGPGRGTLMADMLRAARVLPGFLEAAEVHFIETSPALRQAQKQAVPDAVWHDTAATLPQLPTLLLANEFFDALPIRQHRKTESGWAEIMVTADGDALACADGPTEDAPFSDALSACLPDDVPPGTIVESCPAGEAAMTQLASHVTQHSGALLIIDYGHAARGCGDSFQALKAHAPVDPLAEPGLADLTAHVNFPLLVHLAAAAGLTAAPVCGQGAFLEALGLNIRAQQLCQADPARAVQVQAERHRLAAPDQMGRLFKVLGAASADMPPLAGFPQGDAT